MGADGCECDFAGLDSLIFGVLCVWGRPVGGMGGVISSDGNSEVV